MKWIYLLILAFTVQAFSYEVDQFTRRDEKPKDSTEILDAEIQRRLALAITNSNKGFLRFKCNGDSEAKTESRIHLFKSIKSQFESATPIGVLESYIGKESKIQKRKIALSDSIYSGAKNYSKILNKFGVAPVVTVNNVQIGADKLGHFFDQGYTEYVLNYKSSTEKQKYRDGVIHSLESEKYEYGGATTGVTSYGDISANYAGQKFWENICGYPNKDTSEADKENMKTYRCKKDAYVYCDPNSGDWVLNPKRQFTLKDYVTPAWDESINCSLYQSDAAASITSEMSRRVYTYKGNPAQPCPAEPQKCIEMQDSYPREIASLLTSPVCKKIVAAKRNGESIDKKEKFNYEADYWYSGKSEKKPDLPEYKFRKTKAKN